MILDANVIIAYLGGDEQVIQALTKIRQRGRLLLLPTIAETEVLSFSGWSAEELRSTERFLEENFASIPFDRTVARIAAEIRRKTRIKTPDAAIAATALFTHTPLLTRNIRDFQRVSNLQVKKI